MRLTLRSITLLLLLLVGYVETHADTVKSAPNVGESKQAYPAKPVRIIDRSGRAAGPTCWPVPWPQNFLSCGANP